MSPGSVGARPDAARSTTGRGTADSLRASVTRVALPHRGRKYGAPQRFADFVHGGHGYDARKVSATRRWYGSARYSQSPADFEQCTTQQQMTKGPFPLVPSVDIPRPLGCSYTMSGSRASRVLIALQLGAY